VKNLLAFWRSTPGKKVVMGATGLVMIAWLVLHMVGNLQAFSGGAKLDAYAAILHGPAHELVLAIRALLLVCLALHVVAAVQLTLLDRAARPTAYARKVSQAATPASMTLRIGGVLLLAFIILHLMHFTTGQIHPSFIEGEVFRNLVIGLRVPAVALGYLVAMAALGLHLFHGAWASLRSLGAARPQPNPLHRPIARVLAIAVWLGFSIIPVAVQLGWLTLPGE
jgi:succinate dehydrogenase / fumarate reductase cytochrome b subunit